MQKIAFLNDESEVSPLCLGTMYYGATLAHEDCYRQMDMFLQHNGNFIDTAHVYNDWIPGERGRSEKVIGAWMRARDCRKQVFLSTKGAHPDLDIPGVSRVRPEYIEQDLQESLEYLQTDFIDLYFLHRDDPSVPVAELLDCLNRQMAAGRIKALGCSNWTLERMREANEAAQKHGWAGFAVNQLMWSLARIREAGLPDRYVVMDEDFHRYHREHNLPVMCFSSQAKGYFARRDAGENLPEDVMAVYNGSENDTLYVQLRDYKVYDPDAMVDIPLQFFPSQPFPAVPIVSCDDVAQLEGCLHALEAAPMSGFPWPDV